MRLWFCRPLAFTVFSEVHQIENRVLLWKSQSRITAIKWVCIHICFPFHQGLVLVISSLEFLRRLVMGLSVGKEPSSALPQSHQSTPLWPWAPHMLDTRLDLSQGQTQQPHATASLHFQLHLWRPPSPINCGKPKGLPSPFPFPFSSLIVKSPAYPSSK